jgi:hypothetical protein
MNLNELALQVHAANTKWWHDIHTGEPIQRNKGELLMLVITELSEAVEGIRKDLMDDKLPHRKMEEVEMADAVIRLLDFAGGFRLSLEDISVSQVHIDDVKPNKGEAIIDICLLVTLFWGFETTQQGFGSGISRIIHAIRTYCLRHGLELEGTIYEKLAYNAKRSDHTHEARKAAGGKKF